jgi:hypothetical protein
MNATTIATTRIPPIVPKIAPTTDPALTPEEAVGDALAATALPVTEDEVGMEVT